MVFQRNRGHSTKRVHFKDEADQQIEAADASVSSLEVVDKSALWYSRRDLQELQQKSQAPCFCQAQENQIKGGNVTMSINYCDCQTERWTTRQEFVANLLLQQQEHKRMGVDDPKGLFQFSRAWSKAARRKALRQGQDHAECVRSFLERRQTSLEVVDDALQLLLLPE